MTMIYPPYVNRGIMQPDPLDLQQKERPKDIIDIEYEDVTETKRIEDGKENSGR